LVFVKDSQRQLTEVELQGMNVRSLAVCQHTINPLKIYAPPHCMLLSFSSVLWQSTAGEYP